jgi:AraC-like DNA-binding protein
MTKRNEDQFRRLRRAQEFMDAHLDSKVSINEIADIACYSQFHFIRKFSETYSKTPNQYLIERRIQEVKLRLKMDRESVTDICMGVGFESPGSFSNLFKKVTGLSPREYRQLKQRIFVDSKKYPIIHVPACFAMFFAPTELSKIPKEY